jgi:potassium-transporting ATPase potassium-binding subunit
MAHVFMGQATFATRCLGWLERGCYKIGGVNPEEEMTWVEYGKALLLLNFMMFIVLFLMLFL